MRRIHISLNLLLLSLWLLACEDKKTTSPDTFLISEELLNCNLNQEEQVIEIPVKTNLGLKDWNAESDHSEWCKVTKYNNSLSLEISASQEADVRNARVTVSSSVKKYEINITQLGIGKAILLNPRQFPCKVSGEELILQVTANIPYTLKTSPGSEWIKAMKTKTVSEDTYHYQIDANPEFSTRKAVLLFEGTEHPEVNDSCVIIQAARSGSSGSVVIEGDIQIKPVSGKASENQPGQGIENCFDGKFASEGAPPYHSIWGQKARFPVSLEFFFDGKEEIDYLIYYTRSGNGNFGKLKIYTATTEAPDYALAGDYDFKMQNIPSRIHFKGDSRKFTKIKFSIESGLNDFVSCDEMQFFRKNRGGTLEQSLLTVFNDISCSELRQDVTSEKINNLPDYFKRVATALKNGEYDEWQKNFRIRDYKAYSEAEVWADKLMTKKYSNLDNCTGIYASKGDTLIVLAGDTHKQSISLQSIGETNGQTNVSGDVYFLEEGVNKICMKNNGMLFLMYNTDISSAPPIRIHIPIGSGTVNGFFDLNEHQTNSKYAELLRKATYKYFFVRGDNIIFYFHREKLLEFVPNEILSAIHLWDNIVSWQQELMGIEDVRPSKVNNHLFAISPESGYMWASDYQIGFVYTYLNNILLYDNVMAQADNAWGPAHEIGHIHQKAINWPGCTESSNNLFSNYIIYKLGKYCSRGTELSALATNRLIRKDPWVTMGSSTHQGEDTEIHMRMNWQLWNYYHRCGYKTNFWQTLFKLLRTERIVESDPGAAQLLFAQMACKAANQDLSDFFEMWGFFVPINQKISQYGDWQYTVTQAMIDDAKTYMHRFPKMKHAFYYLEDRKNGDTGIGNYKVGDIGHYTQFKNNQQITKTITYTRSGQQITIQDGDEAVAFEIRKNGELLFFSNFLTFEIPSSISLEGTEIQAVQADGKRIILNPAN